MQPNVIFSASNSGPAVALKASKQIGPAANDGPRAAEVGKPRKADSDFARMVSDQSKPTEAKPAAKDASAGATRATETGDADITRDRASGSEADAANVEVKPEAEAGRETEAVAGAEGIQATPVEATAVPAIVPVATAAAPLAVTAKDIAATAATDPLATPESEDASAPAQGGDTEAQVQASAGQPGAAAAGAETAQQVAMLPEAAQAVAPPPLKDARSQAQAEAQAEAQAVGDADTTAPTGRTADRPAATGVVAEDATRVSAAETGVRDGTAQNTSFAAASAAVGASPVQGTTEQMPQTTAAGITAPQALQSTAPAQQLAAAAPPQAQVPDAPVQQMAVHVTRAAKEGADRIEIQLKPVELGRVDVKLEIGHDGRVQAVVSAERPETLDMLRRDVQQLERALTHAGFNTDKESFTFAERGGDRGQQAGGRGNGQGDGSGNLSGDEQVAESANDNRRRMAIDRPGVDVKV